MDVLLRRLHCLFDLLGILYAKEGKKATTFDRIFGSLGVVFDLSEIGRKTFSLSHTASRRSELVESLEGLLNERIFLPKMLNVCVVVCFGLRTLYADARQISWLPD